MMDSGSISSVSILFARAAVLVPEVPEYMCRGVLGDSFCGVVVVVVQYTGVIIYSTINHHHYALAIEAIKRYYIHNIILKVLHNILVYKHKRIVII